MRLWRARQIPRPYRSYAVAMVTQPAARGDDRRAETGSEAAAAVTGGVTASRHRTLVGNHRRVPGGWRGDSFSSFCPQGYIP